MLNRGRHCVGRTSGKVAPRPRLAAVRESRVRRTKHSAMWPSSSWGSDLAWRLVLAPGCYVARYEPRIATRLGEGVF